MNNTKSMAKRIMAMMLVLTMMLTTLGGYAPEWFAAFAEDAAQAEEAPQDQPASDGRHPKHRRCHAYHLVKLLR